MNKSIIYVLNYFSIIILMGFTLMFPFGAWKADPFWIILFGRVWTIGFTDVHFTSIAAISIVCAYLIVRDRKTIQPFQWVFVVFAGAGLHEWMLYLWGAVLFNTGIINFWKDAIWFAVFIIVGFSVANKRQRMMLGFLAAYLFVIMGLYVGAFHNSELEIGVYSMQTVADNFIEVLGWVTTALAFLF